MRILIRQTKVPGVKRYGNREMEHYSKSRRREFTPLYIYAGLKYWGSISNPKEATFYILEVSQEATGRAYGVIHHSYIKWCHDGVILQHNSSIEYFNSFYVPMTSCCIVITNCIMCQIFEYNEMERVLTDFFMWNFLMFALIPIILLLKFYYNIIVYNWDCIIIDIRQKSPLS